MIRYLALLSFIPIFTGCAHRTFKTAMCGDMRMSGKMDMSGQVTTTMRADNSASRLASVPVYGNAQTRCDSKVAVIDVDGVLVNRSQSGLGSMGENPVALFREKLDAIESDPAVQSVVLRINSPGGGVTASDIMLRDLQEFKRRRGIPVVACLMDVATGGAYYVATGADAILTHPTSVTGGLGVILNVYNMELTLSQFNIEAIHVKAGDSIDIASPERLMEAEEREALQAMADSFHRRLQNQVRAARPQLLAGEPATSTTLFDGRVFTGQQAAEFGLADQTGYLDDAVALARNLAGMPDSTPVVMLRRDNDRAHTLHDVTPTGGMSSLFPIKIPGMDRAELPTFLYMWQPEPTLASAASL